MTRTGTRITAACGVALLALTAAACGGADEPAATQPQPTISAPGDTAPDVLTLDAGDFVFSPATLSAPAGAVVTIDVKNTGQAPHTFTAKSVNIDRTVEAGKAVQVSFTMPAAGLPFVCRFHESQKMAGTIKAT